MKLMPAFVSIRTKLLVLFCLMITVPFLLSGFMTYRKYSASLERDAQAYSRQMTEQISINLERYIKEIERITMSLYYDENVIQILNRHRGAFREGSYLTSEELSKMSLLMSAVIYERTEVEGIFIFALDGSLFSNLQETARFSWQPDTNEWMAKARAKDGGLVVLPPSAGDYYLQAPREVVSLARLIKDPYTNERVGYVKIDLTSEGFGKILSSVRITEQSELYIFNGERETIYPFGAEGMQTPLASYRSAPETWLVSERETGYGQLHIVSAIPRSDLQRDARQLIHYTLWISLASLIAAYLASVFTSSRLVKPIRSLHQRMKRVQNGELQERAPVTTNDEIGLLTSGFNQMVGQLERTLQEMVELSLKEKESELAALQSQINPHFLYNTLEAISMSARRERGDELSEVIASLGKLLRYTVNRQERLVPLSEELAFVENYLNIQQFRLEDRLRADIRIDLSHEAALVPKLILQPLVENAIEHGMGARPLTITLWTRAVDQDVLIYAADDGVGMTPERLRAVEQSLDEPERPSATSPSGSKRTKGFALRNIHRRLQLLYGPPYGLYIESSSQEGTVFYLHLPFQWEE